jgi:hypothetical protein
MEIYIGRAHLPGADEPCDIQVEIDWGSKSVLVRIDEKPGGKKEWRGLAVQTFGDVEEIVFRTMDIPGLVTRWWHLYRSSGHNLQGFILATPDSEGKWRTCSVILNKIKQYS